MTMYTDLTGTTLTTLSEALRAHLHACPLPELAMVTLHVAAFRIIVQAGGGRDAVTHLGELLAWAATLEQVTVEWWHTPSGDLHITIEGRSAAGIAFTVYGGIPFELCAGLVRLAPDASEDVSLDELDTFLGSLRDHRVPAMEAIV